MNNTNISNLIKFIQQLRPIEFIGLARLMSVPIYEDDSKTLRPSELITLGIVDRYQSLSRDKRRQIYSEIKNAARANKSLKRTPQDTHGSNSEN